MKCELHGFWWCKFHGHARKNNFFHWLSKPAGLKPKKKKKKKKKATRRTANTKENNIKITCK